MKIKYTLIAITSCLIFCKNSNTGFQYDNATTWQDSVKALYLSTSIGSDSLHIFYTIDSGLLINYQKPLKNFTLKINQNELPGWFNPLGYTEEANLLVVQEFDHLDFNAKIIRIHDSIIGFPVFDRSGFFNLCFITLAQDGNVRLFHDAIPVPLDQLAPGGHYRIIFDQTKSLFASSEFFPVRQSGSMYTLYEFTGGSFILSGNMYISDERCPYPLMTNMEEQNQEFTCVQRILFKKI
jgi:hypothetical protein